MARFRSKDTKPEVLVRSMLYRAGFRFRVHVKSLPGHPDIVLSKHKSIVQVHGCFWHSHDCHIAGIPKSNQKFWLNKFEKNKERDRSGILRLNALGYKVLVVWECAITGKTSRPANEIAQVLRSWILYDSLNAEVSGMRPVKCEQ